jgi:hypothetical protein
MIDAIAVLDETIDSSTGLSSIDAMKQYILAEIGGEAISYDKLVKWYSRGIAIAGDAAVGCPELSLFKDGGLYWQDYSGTENLTGTINIGVSSPAGAYNRPWQNSSFDDVIFNKNPAKAYCGRINLTNRFHNSGKVNIPTSYPRNIVNGLIVWGMDHSYIDVYDVEVLLANDIQVISDVHWRRQDVPESPGNFYAHWDQYSYSSAFEGSIVLGGQSSYCNADGTPLILNDGDMTIFTHRSSVYATTYDIIDNDDSTAASNRKIVAYRGSVIALYPLVGMCTGMYASRQLDGDESKPHSTYFEASGQVWQQIFADEPGLSRINKGAVRYYDASRWFNFKSTPPIGGVDREYWGNEEVGDTTLGKVVDRAQKLSDERKPMMAFASLEAQPGIDDDLADEADFVVTFPVSGGINFLYDVGGSNQVVAVNVDQAAGNLRDVRADVEAALQSIDLDLDSKAIKIHFDNESYNKFYSTNRMLNGEANGDADMMARLDIDLAQTLSMKNAAALYLKSTPTPLTHELSMPHLMAYGTTDGLNLNKALVIGLSDVLPELESELSRYSVVSYDATRYTSVAESL